MTTSVRTFMCVALAASLFVMGSSKVMAADGAGKLLGAGLESAVPEDLKEVSDIKVIIGGILKGALGLTGVLLLAYLLYGGFKFMTAGGDSKQVGSAIEIIRNAVIGITIIAASYAATTFVIGTIGNATSKASEKSVPSKT